MFRAPAEGCYVMIAGSYPAEAVRPTAVTCIFGLKPARPLAIAAPRARAANANAAAFRL